MHCRNPGTIEQAIEPLAALCEGDGIEVCSDRVTLIYTRLQRAMEGSYKVLFQPVTGRCDLEIPASLLKNRALLYLTENTKNINCSAI